MQLEVLPIAFRVRVCPSVLFKKSCIPSKPPNVPHTLIALTNMVGWNELERRRAMSDT